MNFAAILKLIKIGLELFASPEVQKCLESLKPGVNQAIEALESQSEG